MSAWSAEVRAGFLFRLRSRGIRDLAVLRAAEAVPRDSFVPHRYADLAGRDVALPLPCGQTLSEPSLVARMVEALGVEPASRVLDVGSGSGYAAAILARLGREVLGIERFRTLARSAAARLSDLGVENAAVLWGHGLAVPPDRGPFDRILVHAVLPGVPAELDALLAPGGTIVFALGDARGQRIVRGRRDLDGGWKLEAVAPSRLRPLLAGVSELL